MIQYIDYDKDDNFVDEIHVVQGDSGPVYVELDGYELQEGDRLILNVKEFPDADSPILLTATSATDSIWIDCEATRSIPAGRYSAQIFLQTYGTHCPVEVWPDMSDRKPRADRSLKNFIVEPGVRKNG